MEKKIHLGYRYKLKISDGQKSFLDHHMFIYNQAYNICLNLWLKENEKNKNLPKKLKQYRSATGYDTVVKRALRFRKLTFSTVVTQQARINFLKAVKRAFSKEIVSARLKAIETAQTLKEKVKANQLGMQHLNLAEIPFSHLTGIIRVFKSLMIKILNSKLSNL